MCLTMASETITTPCKYWTNYIIFDKHSSLVSHCQFGPWSAQNCKIAPLPALLLPVAPRCLKAFDRSWPSQQTTTVRLRNDFRGLHPWCSKNLHQAGAAGTRWKRRGRREPGRPYSDQLSVGRRPTPATQSQSLKGKAKALAHKICPGSGQSVECTSFWDADT